MIIFHSNMTKVNNHTSYEFKNTSTDKRRFSSTLDQKRKKYFIEKLNLFHPKI